MLCETLRAEKLKGIDIVIAREEMDVEPRVGQRIGEGPASPKFVGGGGGSEVAPNDEVLYSEGSEVLAVGQGHFHVKLMATSVDDVDVTEEAFVPQHGRVAHDFPEMKIGDMNEGVVEGGHGGILLHRAGGNHARGMKWVNLIESRSIRG